LKQFVQEIERIIISLQNNLDHLWRDSNKRRKDKNIVLKLKQDVDLLVELQVSAKDYLNEYSAHLLREGDDSISPTNVSSIEMLEGFIIESRHPIASIQGWVGLIKSNDEPNLESQFSKGLNAALLTLKNMCEEIEAAYE
jgi:hypothetical protein